jgi:hypothetical protein
MCLSIYYSYVLVFELKIRRDNSIKKKTDFFPNTLFKQCNFTFEIMNSEHMLAGLAKLLYSKSGKNNKKTCTCLFVNHVQSFAFSK